MGDQGLHDNGCGRGDRTAVIALSVAAGLSVALAIGAGHLIPGRGWLAYIFKPLSTTLLVAIAAVAPRPVFSLYKWGIVAGLIFSLGGDILLMLPDDHFLPGLVSFLIAHMCYLVAFTSDCGVAARRAPFVAWAFVGAAVVLFVCFDIPDELIVYVLLYAAFILAMAAQATSRALVLRSPGAVAAAIGATLFVLSDSLLAIGRFRGGLPWSDVLVLSSYFTGQWLIAVSVSFCLPSIARPPGDTSTP